jgi:hypothetical protein
MPKRFIHRAYKGRSNKIGPAFPEERNDSDYAIQSVLELEEKRLGRMLNIFCWMVPPKTYPMENSYPCFKNGSERTMPI